MKLLKAIAVLACFLLAPIAMGLKLNSEKANIHIETEKVIRLRGHVTNEMYFSYLRQMMTTSALPGDRVIILDTPGGIEDPGRSIIELMETEKLQGVRQICVVPHQAASMGFNILTHCDVRLATSKALIMAHVLALEGVDCVLNRCTPAYLRKEADKLAEDDLPYRRDNARALRLTPSDYDEYAAKDYVWPVEELVARGYLDAIIRLR